MKSITIDPCSDGLRAHTCIRHIPLWPDNSPRMESLRREMQSSGSCAPIFITAKHEILDADSRERWRAARALQLHCIPACIVPDDQVAGTSLHNLCQRRHLTKSALAYLAFPLLKTALDEAQARALKMLKNANDLPSGAERRTMKSVEEIAESLGLGSTTLKEARRVHEIFAKDAAYKAQIEPRLLAEPVGGEHEQHRPLGLGAIIAGYAGKQNENKPRQDRGQLELFGAAVKTFCLRAPLPVHAAEARRVVRETLDQLTPEEIENVERTAALIVSEARALHHKS